MPRPIFCVSDHWKQQQQQQQQLKTWYKIELVGAKYEYNKHCQRHDSFNL